MSRGLLFLCLFALLTAASAADAAGALETRLRAHIATLSSDTFEGRAPATNGEKKTIAYIAQQFAAAGLRPGGDRTARGVRGWTQRVELMRSRIEGPVSVTIGTPAGGRLLIRNGDIILRASPAAVDRVAIRSAPLVFVGYGVAAPELKWDDFKNVDVRGKVVVALANDPDCEGGDLGFGGKTMSWYGRLGYKYQEAARRGAIGLLIIHKTETVGYNWQTAQTSFGADTYDIVRSDAAQLHPILEAWIAQDAARALFRQAGLDYDLLATAARSRDFHPTSLADLTLSADQRLIREKIVTHNVVGLVVGKRPSETVLYSAHWDAFGVGPPDSHGDRIFNGASDNATGIAMLIELGRRFAHGYRPRRSLVFLATTAEERGLLGAEYYAAHPLYPLETTAAAINVDTINGAGRSRTISTHDDTGSSLVPALAVLAAAHGRTLVPYGHPEAGILYRTDQFPFAKRGVPAISFAPGRDLEHGGLAAGEAAKAKYLAERYHQRSDEYDPAWNLDSMVADGELMYALGNKIANGSDWPDWREGAKFKAERERSATVRSIARSDGR